jgi:hypothetical protein
MGSTCWDENIRLAEKVGELEVSLKKERDYNIELRSQIHDLEIELASLRDSPTVRFFRED